MSETEKDPFNHTSNRNTLAHFLKKISFSLAALVIIALLGFIAFFGLQWQTQMRQQEVRNSTLNNQVTQLNTQLQQLQTQITSLNTQAQTQAQMSKNNASQLIMLNSTLLGKQSGWLVAEAIYLVKLANYNLQFQHNVPVSIILLQNADQTLARIADPRTDKARAILAKNIVKLQAVPVNDTAGLYLRLEALSNQIAGLPTLNESPAVTRIKEQATKASLPSNIDWHKNFKNNMLNLGNLIIIQHRTKPLGPLLTPTQDRLVKQYLFFLFAQTQWSLLNNNPQIYQSSLMQINNTLEQYYATNSILTQQMITNIQQLQTVNLAPKLPDISNSLPALDSLEKTLVSNDNQPQEHSK